jgi:hypothetical protein
MFTPIEGNATEEPIQQEPTPQEPTEEPIEGSIQNRPEESAMDKIKAYMGIPKNISFKASLYTFERGGSLHEVSYKVINNIDPIADILEYAKCKRIPENERDDISKNVVIISNKNIIARVVFRLNNTLTDFKFIEIYLDGDMVYLHIRYGSGLNDYTPYLLGKVGKEIFYILNKTHDEDFVIDYADNCLIASECIKYKNGNADAFLVPIKTKDETTRSYTIGTSTQLGNVVRKNSARNLLSNRMIFKDTEYIITARYNYRNGD